MKEVQQTHLRKSSGKSKEVEALIGSLTDQEDKHNSNKPIRTIDDITIGDRVRLKTGIICAYGGGYDIQNNRSVGKVSFVSSRISIGVDFPEGASFHCTLNELEFAT